MRHDEDDGTHIIIRHYLYHCCILCGQAMDRDVTEGTCIGCTLYAMGLSDEPTPRKRGPGAETLKDIRKEAEMDELGMPSDAIPVEIVVPGKCYGQEMRDYTVKFLGVGRPPPDTYAVDGLHWTAQIGQRRIYTQVWRIRVRYKNSPVCAETTWHPDRNPRLRDYPCLYPTGYRPTQAEKKQAERGLDLMHNLTQKRGRPAGTASYNDPDELRALIIETMKGLIRNGLPPGELNVCPSLYCGLKTLQRNLTKFGLSWVEMRGEAYQQLEQESKNGWAA